jgi:hypothetical protein
MLSRNENGSLAYFLELFIGHVLGHGSELGVILRPVQLVLHQQAAHLLLQLLQLSQVTHSETNGQLLFQLQ